MTYFALVNKSRKSTLISKFEHSFINRFCVAINESAVSEASLKECLRQACDMTVRINPKKFVDVMSD